MEAVFKSEVFFIITSVFVVVLTVVLIIAGYYLIRILKNFSDISTRLKNTVHDAEGELRDMGMHVRKSRLFTFMFGKPKKSVSKKVESEK